MNFATFVRKANLLKRRCEKCHDAVRQIEITVNQSSLTDILIRRLTGYHEEIVEKKRDFEHILNLCLSEDPSDYDEDTVLKLQDEISDLVCESRAIISSLIPMLNGNPQTPTVDNENDAAQSATAVRLPKLELPRFSGDSVKWMSFYNTFDTTIHQSLSLSRIEKFQYLNSCLQGEALELIRGLPLSDSNYLIAWDLLRKRYHNIRKLVSMHITKIMDMPNLSGNSLVSFRSFLSTYHENIQALSALGHDITKENILLVTILLRKLDFGTRKRLEDTRNENHELPIASELIKFLERECAHLEDASVDARVKPLAVGTTLKNISVVSSYGNGVVTLPSSYPKFQRTTEKFLSPTASQVNHSTVSLGFNGILLKIVIPSTSSLHGVTRRFFLAWLQRSPHLLKTFVANRVADIQDKIPPHHWHHVVSSQNPADCASRGPLKAIPEDDHADVPLNRLSRWKMVQAFAQRIWKRWHMEYLHTLQQRTKWTLTKDGLKEGDLVLVQESNTPPLLWCLARISGTSPGEDGVVRVVHLRTAKGTLTRPAVKLPFTLCRHSSAAACRAVARIIGQRVAVRVSSWATRIHYFGGV
ncbi:uncharacterized protein LOC124162657 [Ischnura elegans]|uniref:uncharacterized protein LOC124162657 n=1 Tax=Ischnura elegans TaxID=197161 RepID=UPI001ED891E9|nr:uncharacterized protein LOC124162657 [Ischnura elegans]